MKQAMLFPGQGAQFVGMGGAFLADRPASRRVLDRANEVLGIDLGRICLEGPEEELRRTEICQPAILATSLAILAAVTEDPSAFRARFHAAAGLSLGEYTALVFSGALEFDDALALVRKRGRYMQECSDRHPSGMVSLLGADEAVARRICEQASAHGIAGIANLNGGGQVVLSGDRDAMRAVVEAARGFGVRRAVPLRVSGAFHSERMRAAAERLRRDLRDVPIRRPELAFLSNVTGAPVDDPEEIRRHLGEQVVSTVRWEATIRALVDAGVERFVEPGPGQVLTGLVRKISPSSRTATISTLEEAQAEAQELAACPAERGRGNEA